MEANVEESRFYQLESGEVLVKCLSKLANLTHLHVIAIPYFFDERHVVQLARSLPKLEFWWTRGF